MDPLVSTVTTAVVTAGLTSLASKGASAPAKTLNLLWQATLGRWDPLLQQIVNKNIKKYAKEIDNEVDKIPLERINSKPDISIIGPALEASKYYVDREESRKMFARLIAAELDLLTADKVHHSFVDIIKQMSSNDAKLLSILPNDGPLAQIQLYFKDGKSYIPLTVNDVILIPGLVETNFEDNAISINNLSRLGLVEIDHIMSISISEKYDAYKKLDAYRRGELSVNNFPEKYRSVEIKRGMFVFTPYGELFKKICL